MLKLIRKFSKNENGAAAIEYVFIAALIGLAIVAGAGALGTSLNSALNSIATKVGSDV
jgi:pilus assembly protein Flp/PilA